MDLQVERIRVYHIGKEFLTEFILEQTKSILQRKFSFLGYIRLYGLEVD